MSTRLDGNLVSACFSSVIETSHCCNICVAFSICFASKERLHYSFYKITMVENFDSKGGKCKFPVSPLGL